MIYANDVEAARRFYDCLGLQFQIEKHGTGPEHWSANVGETVFELYPRRENTNGGTTRIGFVVSSVDAIVERLRQQQAAIISEPKDSAWGRRAVVEDPDGNRIELTEHAGQSAAVVAGSAVTADFADH